jgi:hypothetical protein
LPHHDEQASDNGNPRHGQELFLVTCSCRISAC